MKKKNITKIKFYRLYCGIKLKEIADEMGVTSSNISIMENYRRIPKTKTFEKFKKFYADFGIAIDLTDFVVYAKLNNDEVSTQDLLEGMREERYGFEDLSQ